MNTDRVGSRVVTMIIVVTGFVIGMSLPAGAAGEEGAVIYGQYGLTFDGRPLSQVVAGTARVPFQGPLHAFTERETERVGSTSGAQQPTSGKGRGALFWTAVGAGIGAGVGLLVIRGVDCDLPENQCPLPPMMGAVVGGLMGLMFGFSR